MLHCSHFFEHIPGPMRPAFMDEAFRVLKKGGQLVIIVPHWSSMRSIQDFTHAWPPVGESSFLYFNKTWREQNKLTHGAYTMNCDFDFSYGYVLDPSVQVRNTEFQQFAIKQYVNAVMDIHVTLTKK
jgi:ubiquinone/menaquinone biosynthesis C-methylase UbiE